MWMDSRELEAVDGSAMQFFLSVRHADTLRVGDTDEVLWYTTLDELGRRAVGYAATTATPGVPRNRACDVEFAKGDDFPNDVFPPPDTGTPRDWPRSGAADHLRGDTAVWDSGGETGTDSADDSAGDSEGDSGGDSGLDSGEDSAADSGDDTASDSGGDSAADSALDSAGEAAAPLDMGDGKGPGCASSSSGGCASVAVAPGWAVVLGLAALRRRRP